MSIHATPIPDWLNAKYMETNLQSCLQDRDLTVSSIEVLPASAVGENYTSQVVRVITNISHSKTGANTLPLIGKIEISTTTSEEFKKDFDMFEVEINFYTKLQPELEKVIESVPQLENYKPMPKFYFVDEEKRIIFMEDLKPHGFVMQERTKFLNLLQAELAMDALATFHGASLSLLRKQPHLRQMLSGSFYGKILPKPMQLLIKNATSSLEKHISSYGLPDRYCRRLVEIQSEIDSGRLEVCQPQENKINVISHGDCWKNNVMYSSKNGFDEIKLIDFQAIRCNSFGQDLLNFLFLSVSSDILVTKFDHLLEKYYNRIKVLAPNESSITLDRLKLEISEQLYFGYFLSVLFRTFVIAKVPVDMERIMTEDGLQDNGFDDPIYKSDLHNLLPFFEKMGVL